MKLSAPPPPPPPPSDGTPGENAPGSPDEQPNPNPPGAPSTPATDVPTPSSTPVANAPGSPQTPKPATWPAWYSGIDAALVGLVLVFAFVAASFVARNSDLWLHLAAGKRLFAGEYFPGGSDPFSYSAEGRTWVNHNWLTDAAAYLLYGGTGQVLVGAKALVVALAFGILIAIRRARFALWPWAAVACVAVLAAAPQFTLRPLVVSMLLLAVTMYLLFRMPHKKHTTFWPHERKGKRYALREEWRFPAAIGITFWVWANCDQWFFIGPFALALLIIGDLIQKYGFNAPDEPEGDPDAEPLGRLPDTQTLAKALAVGLLACTLTPHHVRVWELPFELIGASGVDADPSLRVVLLTPVESEYINKPGRGYNANGLAYVILLVAGAAIVGLAGGLGVGRIRIAHTALWIGFAVLSLLSIYTVPFFALVAVPLVAAQLNAFSTRAQLKTWGDPRTRLILIGSSGGRVLSVFAMCLLCVLAYPGWVHPEPPAPAYARRVAWAVEPEQALVQTAEQLKAWRETDALPADARGVIMNTDLANYMAWFAPREKVFINSRFTHHRRELADYVTMRKGLGLVVVKDEPPNPKDTAEVLTRRNADYVATYGASIDVSRRMYLNWGEWSVWYTDGRTMVFGWHPAAQSGKPTFAGLRLDPAVKAFGREVKKAADPTMQQPLIQPEAELDQMIDSFKRAPKPPPPGAAEALGWIAHKQALIARHQVRQQLSGIIFLGGFSNQPPQSSFHHFAIRLADWRGLLAFPPKHEDSQSDADAMRAIPILAVRAARRAIAEDPDHPDAYFSLAQALRDPELPLTESERALGIVTALRQCLERLPKPSRYKRGQFAVFGTRVALELAEAYLGQSFTWRDPATKKEVIAHTGFPIDIPGLREWLVNQTILIDPQGQLVRVPTQSLGLALAQAPRGTRPYANGVPHLLAIDLARSTLKLALEYAPADLSGEGSETAQAAVKEVKTQLTNLENEEIGFRDRYEAGKRRSTKLDDLVQHAIQNCMLGEARDLLADADIDTLNKDYGDKVLISGIQRVAIELAIGRIEDADENLKILSAPERAGAVAAFHAARPLQQLKYHKAMLAGEYRAAGDLWESLNQGIGQIEKLPPPGSDVPLPIVLGAVQATQGRDPKALLAMIAPPLTFTPGHAQVLQLRFWFVSWVNVGGASQQWVAGQLSAEAEFFYRRGVLLLLEGNIPGAKERFKDSARKAPPGWGILEARPPLAGVYLDMIERAEKGKK